MTRAPFVCLPFGSHRDYERNCRGRNPLGNFVRMSGKKDADYCAYRAVQVAPLSAGDLIVWDSRVVHCSAGFDAKADPSSLLRLRHVTEQPPLARLVAYVACARKDAVSASTREKRREAVRKTGATPSRPTTRRRCAGPRRPRIIRRPTRGRRSGTHSLRLPRMKKKSAERVSGTTGAGAYAPTKPILTC